MSNLPMLPSGPSRQDVDSMRKLRSIMDGNTGSSHNTIHEGVHQGGQYRSNPPRPSAPVSNVPYMGGYAPADVNGMKETLNRFYAAQGGKEEYKLMESSKEPYSPNTTTTQSSPSPQLIETNKVSSPNSYEVRTRLEETSNNKTRKRYDILNKDTRTLAYEDIILQDTAEALAKLLNRGLTESSNRIQEVLSLEEEYTKSRSDAVRFKNHYTRSIELGETEAGEVFKKRFSKAKAEALASQESLKSINESLKK